MRASSFRFERHRRRFVAARGILRSIFGRYLACEPAEIRFEYGSHGKPRMVQPELRIKIEFNIAHSDDLALLAFGLGRKVGVDLEKMRDIPEMPQLVSRNFSARESAAWRSLPQAERKLAFFNCWVRKEAFVKAVGDGLSYPLQAFDVSLLPGEKPELLAISGEAVAAKRWTLFGVEAAEGFAAALVAEGSEWRPRFLQFD